MSVDLNKYTTPGPKYPVVRVRDTPEDREKEKKYREAMKKACREYEINAHLSSLSAQKLILTR